MLRRRILQQAPDHYGVILVGANVKHKQLKESKSLKGATMPEGSNFEEPQW